MDPQNQTVPTMTPKGSAPTEPGGDDEEGPGPGTPTHPSLAPTSSPQRTALPSGTPLSPTTASPSAMIGASTPSAGWDFGDAPDPGFPSLLASEGARHLMVQSEWLGEQVDQEVDSRQVDGDLYDDGVEVGELTTCQEADVQVKVSLASREDAQHPYDAEHLLYLNVLVDWDGDGAWGGEVSCPEGLVAPEWALRNLPIDVSSWPQGSTSTAIPLRFLVGPETGEVWSRFTLSYAEPISGDEWDGRGAFTFGETEDHLLAVSVSATDTAETVVPTPAPPGTTTPSPLASALFSSGIVSSQPLLCFAATLLPATVGVAFWAFRRRRTDGR